MLAYIGSKFLSLLRNIGAKFIFAIRIVSCFFSPPFYFKEVLSNFVTIGYNSLPVIGMTAIFTGGVLALQTYSGFSRFNAENSLAAVIMISITRELGPVLGGLMVAGRVGSSIAAEVASMKATEQIDALRTMSVSPYRYIFAPKVLSGIVTMPLLVLIADVIGFYGGYLVATEKLGFNAAKYIHSSFHFLERRDVIMGLTKASVFGFIITSVGCYCGYNANVGAKGVGVATTKSLVCSSTLILISNYIITEVFLR